MTEQWRKRKYRQWQKSSRGDAVSWRTRYEDALIMLAVEAGLVTEAQACRVLEMDRLTFRVYREEIHEAAEAAANMRP